MRVRLPSLRTRNCTPPRSAASGCRPCGTLWRVGELRGPISRPTRACAREAENHRPSPLVADSLAADLGPKASASADRGAAKASRSRETGGRWAAHSGGLQPDRNGLDLGFTRFLLDFSDIRLTGAIIGAGGPGTPKMCGGLPPIRSLDLSRLSATSGLGRWFLPRARTRVSDGKLDLAGKGVRYV